MPSYDCIIKKQIKFPIIFRDSSLLRAHKFSLFHLKHATKARFQFY